MKIFTLTLFSFAFALFLISDPSSKKEDTFETTDVWFPLKDSIIGSNKARIMKIEANMVVDTASVLLELVDRAKAKGANTILYGDTKLNRFGIGQDPGNRWKEETRKFVDGVKERDMDLLFMTISMGFCGAVISDAPNLTTGYPIINQELQRKNNELVPVSSSSIPNGGFESFSGNIPDGWEYQDAAGTRTFVDTTTKRSGNASFRAEGKGGEMSRIITTINVESFHQYTLSFWIKAENLSADNVEAILIDGDNEKRRLTHLRLSKPGKDGARVYFNRPQNLNMEWTEIRIAFNSLNAKQIKLGLSMFGGTSGNLWWDDVQILDTPSLNWLNRDDLPISIQRQDGSNLNFGSDVRRPEDPLLGQSGFPGRYDTHHRAPKILLGNASNITEGEIVEISGYHALPTADGQISCSWNNPEVYARMRAIHERLENTYRADGYLVNYSEIRTGGWEPSDTLIGTSGDALAASINRVFADIADVAPESKLYFWNDMVDPNHNAKPFYYQINNTLENSWVSLDSLKVVVATWWEGQKISDKGPSSLQFFSDLGFEQVIGAYYDEDVNTNFSRWQTAAKEVTGITGNMYATWQKDYTKIEAYGDLWWSAFDDDTNETALDSLSVLTAEYEVEPGKSYTLEVDYRASQERDIVVIFQQNRAPWEGYGYSRTTVSAGDDTAKLTISVNENVPEETDGYKWTVFITPSNEDWKERLFLENVTPISVVKKDNNIENPIETADDFLMTDMSTGPLILGQDFITFPNPSSGEALHLHFKDVQNEVSTRLYDLNGRILEIKREANLKKMKFDTSSLPSGTYLLQVQYDTDIKTIRVLIK